MTIQIKTLSIIDFHRSTIVEFQEEGKMKFDPKWIKIMGLAMSLPTTIFVMAWGSMHLFKIGILSQVQAVLLFLAVVLNTLFLMVYYAYKRKN